MKTMKDSTNVLSLRGNIAYTNNPGTRPDWESNPPPFSQEGNNQPTEPHRLGQNMTLNSQADQNNGSDCINVIFN